jgi:two-component system cell cycle response regulator CtrA
MTESATIIALRDRVAELEEKIRQLESQVVDRGIVAPAEWGLTPKEEAMAIAFAKHGYIDKKQAMTVLWSSKWDIDGEPDPKIFDVMLCHLRKKVKPFGVEIITRWGRGWEMPAASRNLFVRRPVA